MRETRTGLFVVGLLVAGVLLVAAAEAAPYSGSAVVVTRSGGVTTVDNGAVVCDPATGSGTGGACIPFAGGIDSIEVDDGVFHHSIAFVVCIDNNQDGFCGGQARSDACLDAQYFSHRDDGGYDNPIGPLPTSLTGGSCLTTGGFNGYVVFICRGAHDAPSPHPHEANQGTVVGTTGGTGPGDSNAIDRFCGGFGTPPPSPTPAPVVNNVKRYVLQSSNVPTLSEWGLVALVGVVLVAGVALVRKP